MGFRFADPSAFQFLWFILILIICQFLIFRSREKKMNQTLEPKLRDFLTRKTSYSRLRFKRVLIYLSLIFAVLALARPQSGESKAPAKSEGIEIMVLVDVSNSMLAEDTKPSRLELAKKELQRLSRSLSGDKMGLIAFAGSAVLLSPLTTDRPALDMYLESLSPAAVSTQGTEFKKALEEALTALQRGGVGAEAPSITQAIIIASDGEDNEPGAIAVAEKMRKRGIRIFSLGFGTEKGAPIPTRDERGNLVGYRKDRSRQVIISKTKGSVLKELSRVGGGSFHHVTFGGAAIGRLKGELDELQKSTFESEDIQNYTELYQWFLVLAIFFGLVEVLVSARRAPGRIWKGRFEVPEP